MDTNKENKLDCLFSTKGIGAFGEVDLYYLFLCNYASKNYCTESNSSILCSFIFVEQILINLTYEMRD